MNHFSLDIVTPTQNLDVIEVDYVRCPGIDGSFGIMANYLYVLKNIEENHENYMNTKKIITSDKLKKYLV